MLVSRIFFGFVDGFLSGVFGFVHGFLRGVGSRVVGFLGAFRYVACHFFRFVAEIGRIGGFFGGVGGIGRRLLGGLPRGFYVLGELLLILLGAGCRAER